MANVAYGTSIKFTPSGGTQVTIGKLTSIGQVRMDSEDIDVTTLDSVGGAKRYVQGFKDVGALRVEGFFDSDDAGQAALISAYGTGAQGAFTVTFPGGEKAAFTAHVKMCAIGASEVDSAIGFSAELRISGKVTYTA